MILLLASFLKAQNREVLLEDQVSIRAIEIYKGKVFYAGSGAKFGYVSLKDPKDKKQIKLSDKALEFRSIGRFKSNFYTTSIESPAYFYKIDARTLSSTLLGTDQAASAFYDAIHFTKKAEGWSFSDSDSSCPRLAKFNSKTEKWVLEPCLNLPQIAKGEAAFAASNTNIDSKKGRVWIATGGLKSRIWRLEKDQWQVFDTPFVQGTPSSGMYSIDFYSSEVGIAVGGDYLNQSSNKGTIATTSDGGVSWTTQADGQNAGYSTCVKYRPGSKGQQLVALGDQHLSYSKDSGKTWQVLSEEKGLYACEWQNSKVLIAAGRNKIIKLDFSDF